MFRYNNWCRNFERPLHILPTHQKRCLAHSWNFKDSQILELITILKLSLEVIHLNYQNSYLYERVEKRDYILPLYKTGLTTIRMEAASVIFIRYVHLPIGRE